MISIVHREKVWHYAFALPDGMLNEFDRTRLVLGILNMYEDKRKTSKIRGEDFEADLKDSRKTEYFSNGFGGRRYEGKIDCKKGKGELAIIVAEPIDASRN